MIHAHEKTKTFDQSAKAAKTERHPEVPNHATGKLNTTIQAAIV